MTTLRCLFGALALLVCAVAGAQQVTLATIYSNTPDNADLVAFRSGIDGPWQAIAGEQGWYTFTVESDVFSLAILCLSPWGPQAAVYTFMPTELPFVQHVCQTSAPSSAAAGQPQITLSGTVRGIMTGERTESELVMIEVGRESAYLFDGQYSLSVPAETPLDLVAFRTRIGEPEVRALLLRDLQLAEDTQLDLDFDGPDALVLEQHEIRLADATPAFVFAELKTCNGTFISLEKQQYPQDLSELHHLALPAAARRACDRYELVGWPVSISNANADAGERFFRHFTSTPQDKVVMLPEPVAEPCLQRSSAEAAVRVDWEPQEAASFSFLALYDESGVGWNALHSAKLPPSLELPAISELPGWPEILSLEDRLLGWTFSSFSSTAGPGAAMAMMQRLFAFEADMPDIVPDGAELGISSRGGVLPAGTVDSCPPR